MTKSPFKSCFNWKWLSHATDRRRFRKLQQIGRSRVENAIRFRCTYDASNPPRSSPVNGRSFRRIFLPRHVHKRRTGPDWGHEKSVSDKVVLARTFRPFVANRRGNNSMIVPTRLVHLRENFLDHDRVLLVRYQSITILSIVKIIEMDPRVNANFVRKLVFSLYGKIVVFFYRRNWFMRKNNNSIMIIMEIQLS